MTNQWFQGCQILNKVKNLEKPVTGVYRCHFFTNQLKFFWGRVIGAGLAQPEQERTMANRSWTTRAFTIQTVWHTFLKNAWWFKPRKSNHWYCPYFSHQGDWGRFLCLCVGAMRPKRLVWSWEIGFSVGKGLWSFYGLLPSQGENHFNSTLEFNPRAWHDIAERLPNQHFWKGLWHCHCLRVSWRVPRWTGGAVFKSIWFSKYNMDQHYKDSGAIQSLGYPILTHPHLFVHWSFIVQLDEVRYIECSPWKYVDHPNVREPQNLNQLSFQPSSATNVGPLFFFRGLAIGRTLVMTSNWTSWFSAPPTSMSFSEVWMRVDVLMTAMQK